MYGKGLQNRDTASNQQDKVEYAENKKHATSYPEYSVNSTRTMLAFKPTFFFIFVRNYLSAAYDTCLLAKHTVRNARDVQTLYVTHRIPPVKYIAQSCRSSSLSK